MSRSREAEWSAAYLASPAQAGVNITSDEIPPDLMVTALTARPRAARAPRSR